MHRFKVGMLALFLSASAAAPLAAQEWYVGLEGGLNISNLDVENEDFDSETGIRIGGVLRHDFAPNGLIGIQTGVAYSQKGASESDTEGEAAIELDYIEVPLLLAVNVPTNSSVRPRFYAGPQISFEASCTLTGTSGTVSVDLDCDTQELEDLGFNTKGTDFSLLFGGGLEIAAGPGVLTFDGRYDLGLTNINDTEGDETDVKNRNIQLMAGYAFRLQ